MVQINFARKEVNCKLVYYGPGMSGKTTNLEIVHKKMPKENKGDLLAIATEGDRTLFFDFLPLDLGKVKGMNTKFQLYTVPGQVYYASTRKLVLQGADGVIFVADSQKSKLEENLESLEDLAGNLKEIGIDLHNFPFLIQWNKRDLPDAADVAWLEEKINSYNAPTNEAVAVNGEGVMKSLKIAAKMVLDRLNEKKGSPSPKQESAPAEEKKKEDDKIVAVVNGNRITRNSFVSYCQTQYRLSARGEIEDFKKFSKKEELAMLNNLVNYTVLMQEAKKSSVSINKKTLEKQVQQFINKIGPKDKFDHFLASHHLTLDHVRNESIRSIVINTMVKNRHPDLADKLQVLPPEIMKYYESHESAFPGGLGKNEQRIANILKNKKKKKLLDELYRELHSTNKIELFKDEL